jgi:hypothetical protein
VRARLATCAVAAACLALCAPASALASQTLSVVKFGAGAGTVSSEPAGIECGTTCNAAFPNASTVTLSAAPGSHTQAVKWSGCDSVAAEGKCLVTMSGPRTVSATFVLNPLQLKVTKAGTGTGSVSSSPSGISACSTSCTHEFGESETVTLSGLPGANTQAARWSGCDSVNSEDDCLVTMSAAREVTATFDLVTHQLTLTKTGSAAAYSAVSSTPAGIECGGTCQAGFAHGTKVTLTAHPAPLTKPVVWTGCDHASANVCEVTMSAARAVSASFELQPGTSFETLTIERTGAGQGTVTSSVGGIECGALCSTQLIPGMTITLTAAPVPGSAFHSWTGGGCGGAGPLCTTTVKRAETIKATFVLTGTRTLTVTKAGNGQGTVISRGAGIECGATCSSQVKAGMKVALRATASKGSSFAGFSGVCSGATVCSVTMSEARDVTSTFQKVAPPAPPATSALSLSSKAKVRGAGVRLRLSCKGAAACVGTLKLTAKLAGRQVPIGRTRFTIAAGGTETLTVKLSPAALAALRKSGALRAMVSGTGLPGAAVKLRVG